MLKNILKSLVVVALIYGFHSPDTQAQRQPTPAETEAFRQKPCADPWINFAYAVEFKRLPVGVGTQLECDKKLYRDGSWSGYLQLREAVISAQSVISGKFRIAQAGNQISFIYKDFEGGIKLGTADLDTMKLIGNDGSTFKDFNISLTNNPSNILTDMASGVINGNGSNLTVVLSTTPFAGLSTGAKKVITLKNGAKIVIR